jgi:cytochrome c-type biogenesis protein CcmH/NrfG
VRAPQAFTAYNKGLEIDPANEQLKSGLADAEEAQARAQSRGTPCTCCG